MLVTTAYGQSRTGQIKEEERRELLSKVNDRLTIRNPKLDDFASKLIELINSYPLQTEFKEISDGTRKFREEQANRHIKRRTTTSI